MDGKLSTRCYSRPCLLITRPSAVTCRRNKPLSGGSIRSPVNGDPISPFKIRLIMEPQHASVSISRAGRGFF